MSEPETKRVTFNGGLTFWEYDSSERLAQIKAFVAKQEAKEVERPFSPLQMVEATLKVERAMYG